MNSIYRYSGKLIPTMLFLVVVILTFGPARAQSTPAEMKAYLAEHAGRLNTQESLPKDNGSGVKVERFTSGDNYLAAWMVLTEVDKSQVPQEAVPQLDAEMRKLVKGVACDLGFNATTLAYAVVTGNDIFVIGTFLDRSMVEISKVQMKIESAMCY